MTIPSPIFMQHFHKTPRLLDPRIAMARASTAYGINEQGILYSVPANAARWRWNPRTLAPEGVVVEAQRTNLILRSQEFDNASWLKNNCTISANATTAPDGTATADKVTATSTSAYVAQSFTTTAGNGIAISVWAKADRVPFLQITANNGVDLAVAYFRLNLDGQAGVTAIIGSGGTISSLTASIEKYPNGWYRCHVVLECVIYTSWSATFAPAQDDGGVVIDTDSIYLWGAQAEAPSAITSATSYIPTAGATATRNADNLYVALSQLPYQLTEGTLYFELVHLQCDRTTGGSAQLYGGVGDSFANTIYFSRAPTGLYCTANTGGGVFGPGSRTYTIEPGANIKAAFSWSPTTYALAVNGSVITGALAIGLASLVRLSIGGTPYSASSTSNLANACIRSYGLYSRFISSTNLADLTE